MSDFDVSNWYWIVAGDESKWWSSAAAAYVAPVQAWLDAGNLPTRIASEAELWDVLNQQYPAGLPASALAGIDQNTLNAVLAAPGSVVRALALLLLQEINTLRASTTALNAKAGISQTLPQYTTAQLVSALQAKMR